jgi:hypothetical protein
MSLHDQATILTRIFPAWAVEKRGADEEAWELPKKDEVMLARGRLEQGPAWIPGENLEGRAYQARVMGRLGSGSRALTLFTIRAREPMRRGHPDASLIAAQIGRGTPVVLGALGEWSLCKGAVHVVEAADRRFVAFESLSSNHGYVYADFVFVGELTGQRLLEHRTRGPSIMLTDCGAVEKPCTDKRVRLLAKRRGTRTELWVEERGHDAAAGERAPIHVHRPWMTLPYP